MTPTSHVDVVPAVEDDLGWLWHWVGEVVDPEWTHWDGPYFPAEDRTFEEFADEWRPEIARADRALVTVGGTRVGFVSRFEEPPVGGGWWEVGIVLFDPASWGHGIGTTALRLWTDQTFDETDAHVLTLTTWSGNERMVRAGARAGYVECARVPQARSWRGRRWDSVKMARLRSA